MHSLTLSETDYITFQLYEASTNFLKRKSRRKSFFILLALGMMIIISGYLDEKGFMMYYGIFFSLLIVFFGNAFQRWYHKRHYVRHVKNTRKSQSEEIVQLEFKGDHINVKDRVANSIVKISEITQVDEIGTHYFLKVSTGQYLMIPKTNDALNREVSRMINDFKIPHVVDLNWKWR